MFFFKKKIGSLAWGGVGWCCYISISNFFVIFEVKTKAIIMNFQYVLPIVGIYSQNMYGCLPSI